MPVYKGSLATIIDELQLSNIEQVTLQVVEGLRFMHEKGVLHRDVKAENILIEKRTPLEIVLSDHGRAVSFSDRDLLTGVCGTPGFCAPEVDQPGVIQTSAIEVYSLGATIFHMLEPKRFKEDYIDAIRGVARHPPRQYAGLVKAMLAPDSNARISLTQCSTIVTNKDYQWTQQLPPTHDMPLILVPAVESPKVLQPTRETKEPAIARKIVPKPQKQLPKMQNPFSAWEALTGETRNMRLLANRKAVAGQLRHQQILPQPAKSVPLAPIPKNFLKLPAAPTKYADMFTEKPLRITLTKALQSPPPRTNPQRQVVKIADRSTLPISPPPPYSPHHSTTKIPHHTPATLTSKPAKPKAKDSLHLNRRRYPARKGAIHRQAPIQKRIPQLYTGFKKILFGPTGGEERTQDICSRRCQCTC